MYLSSNCVTLGSPFQNFRSFFNRMPLRPDRLLPINDGNIRGEDLTREIAAVHVHTTCERHSYLNGPRRPYTWRILLKLKGGIEEGGPWDEVEIVKAPGSPEIVRLTGNPQMPLRPDACEDTSGEILRFSSMPYPEYGNPFSRDESRFMCPLATAAPSLSAPTSFLPPTVQSVLDVLSTHRFNTDMGSELAHSAMVWDAQLGDVGEMTWVLDVVRALVAMNILKSTEADRLCAEFAESRFRFEIASGSTIIL